MDSIKFCVRLPVKAALVLHRDEQRKTWSGRRGSNPQPTAWEAATLPLSYSRFESNYTAESMASTMLCYGLMATAERSISTSPTSRPATPFVEGFDGVGAPSGYPMLQGSIPHRNGC